MITGFAIGVVSSLGMLLFVFALAQILKRGGGQKLRARTERITRHLQKAIAELMARADELDQDCRYLGQSTLPEVSQRIAKACGDLSLLQDAVKVIETRIESRNLKTAQEDLLLSLGAANKISLEINELREEIRLRRQSD